MATAVDGEGLGDLAAELGGRWWPRRPTVGPEMKVRVLNPNNGDRPSRLWGLGLATAEDFSKSLEMLSKLTWVLEREMGEFGGDGFQKQKDEEWGVGGLFGWLL